MGSTDITAVILAGGKGRRMGGLDKGLMNFAGRPIIEHILEAIRPQCDHIIINANRNRDEYLKYDYPVIEDELNNYQGPLAGFAIALEHSKTPYIVTLPCDAPVIPGDLVKRLFEALQKANADIAVAHDGERLQPVYAIIKKTLAPDLENFLSSGERKIDKWYALNHTVHADFSDIPHIFQNINTPQQQHSLQNEATT
jgi:molybdenum cofactor guanylyltransferase